VDRQGKRVASKVATAAQVARPPASTASELADARAQQAAVDEILRVMADSPADVIVVLNAIAEQAARLCRAPFARMTVVEGDVLRPIAGYAADNQPAAPAGDVPLARTSIQGRAILERRTLHFEDIAPIVDQEFPAAVQNARAMGFRAALAVPLLRGDDRLGAIFLYRREPGLFSPDQVALVETFARQAAIALHSVQQFRATQEALEQQTATSEILRVINRARDDVQPVFDTIAQSALTLCEASSSLVVTLDGGLLHIRGLASTTSEGADAVNTVFPRPPSRDNGATRAVLTSRVEVIPDVLADAEFGTTAASMAAGFRSVLAVPLMRGGTAIGAISVGRPVAGPFPASQVELLQTFAAQAVIAIENVRLFNELGERNRDLSEALEHQTATSEILGVISRSPTDVQPVFDTIAASALRLCKATSALVTLRDRDMVAIVASANLTEEGAAAMREAFPMPIGRQSTSARALLLGKLVAIPDILEDPEYAVQTHALRAAFRRTLAMPLMHEGRAIGTITVGNPEPGRYPESQIALLQTFADQAVIAIENVRLFNELNARTHELTRSVGELRALGEVGQAVSSTLDLGTVLSTIVSRARQLTNVQAGSIYEYDDARQEFLLHSADGLPEDLLDALRKTPMRPGEGALGRMAITGQPVEIRDVVDEQAYRSRVRDRLVKLGLRSMLAVPLLREGHLLGGLVINRKAPGAFDPQVVELLKTFAAQSAIAIENARLFREIEIKSRELETASRHKSEFLANMSHELRTPLNAIIGFSEVLAERLFGELNAKQSEYVADIADSGRHLLALINDILDLSKIEAGRMELDAEDVDLGRTIAQTLSLVRERAERRGIALSSVVDERIGTVHADARKVKQVILNLLSNALKFTPEGGAIAVRAAAFDDRVEVSVADTGIGIAPEDQAAVFEEFRQVGTSAARAEGTGLGLAISRKFIELHGGRMWLASAPGKGSTFTFSLPLRRP
jgi:signal transduction histidine kinase